MDNTIDIVSETLGLKKMKEGAIKRERVRMKEKEREREREREGERESNKIGRHKASETKVSACVPWWSFLQRYWSCSTPLRQIYVAI